MQSHVMLGIALWTPCISKNPHHLKPKVSPKNQTCISKEEYRDIWTAKGVELHVCLQRQELDPRNAAIVHKGISVK